MKSRVFDVGILGCGIGGLVAALTLQRRQAKVVVVSPRPPDGFEPEICEFLSGFTLKPVLKRVGFHPTEVNAIPALEVPLQLIFPSRRIDCFGEEQRFQQEMLREFPDHAQKIIQLFKESFGHLEVYQHLLNSRVPLPPKGFFARRHFFKVLQQVCDASLLKDRLLGKELESFEVGDAFARSVQAMELAMTRLVGPWTSGARLAHLLTLVRWEGYFAPEGLLTIRNLLLQKIRERGGIVLECDKIEEIQFRRKRVNGAKLKGAEFEDLQWQALVVSGDPRGVIAFAPEERRNREWKKQISELTIFSRRAFQLYRLAPDGLPVGMQPQGLIVPDGPPTGQPERRERLRALRYVVRKHTAPGKGEEIHLGLTAFLSPSEDRPGPEQISQEIHESLLTVMPFLDRHILQKPALPFVPSVEGTPGDFRQGLVYVSEKPRLLGVTGISPETPYENTFMSGDLIFPGLGLDGEIIAGLQAAYYAEGHVRGEKLDAA